MQYQLEDRPGIIPLLMYGLQWWIVSIPCVIIIGVIVAQLHYPEGDGQIFYLQKLFGLMGLALIVQVIWGHRLPLIIGPASVLLIGISSTLSTGTAAIYTAIFTGGILLALLAFSGLLSRLQTIFTPRVIVVILCLIAFTLSPVILRLIFSNAANPLFQLLFAFSLALMLLLATLFLQGIWKSAVVLLGMVAGSGIYYLLTGFPSFTETFKSVENAPFWGIGPLHFDPGAILSFFFCFLALTVNELGSIQAVGQMIGADQMQKRTNRGVGITGLANMLSGILGIIGPVDYSMSPGIIASNGCASRYPLIPAGIGLASCAFFPGFIRILNAIPGIVLGAVLLYLMSSQLSAGFQMLTFRKTVTGFNSGIIIGFPLMVALLLSFAPAESIAQIPLLLRPIIGNGFVMGVISVLLLEHLVFREK